ncbi:hypothetical protein IWQ60_002507 [Tieghemiomyces parasiticus]|uniref:Uncharacterized protein n=1 Tax=Tieghemiomyces parasiticus TaxID=78921 RepID=A0A9W8AHX5_9FUNG|nr:hypothetical protein IWQ60_002507 [Tieghemiomyces parasiticus]
MGTLGQAAPSKVGFDLQYPTVLPKELQLMILQDHLDPQDTIGALHINRYTRDKILPIAVNAWLKKPVESFEVWFYTNLTPVRPTPGQLVKYVQKNWAAYLVSLAQARGELPPEAVVHHPVRDTRPVANLSDQELKEAIPLLLVMRRGLTGKLGAYLNALHEAVTSVDGSAAIEEALLEEMPVLKHFQSGHWQLTENMFTVYLKQQLGPLLIRLLIQMDRSADLVPLLMTLPCDRDSLLYAAMAWETQVHPNTVTPILVNLAERLSTEYMRGVYFCASQGLGDGARESFELHWPATLREPVRIRTCHHFTAGFQPLGEVSASDFVHLPAFPTVTMGPEPTGDRPT